MVNGEFRSSQTRKEKRDSSYNYVDRVRLGESSLHNREGPGRGSGWRQKSVSHADLSSSDQGLNKNSTSLRPSRSLDYPTKDNIDAAEFYWKADKERDYEEFYRDCYDEETENLYRSGSYNNHFNEYGGNDLCSLRRSRSLAVIREETFSDLQINSAHNNRRSQLIPRAKLVNRGFFRERFTHQSRLHNYHQHQYLHQYANHEVDDSIGSGFDTAKSQTSETARESDDYYENFKRLDESNANENCAAWHTDRSDLESLNSEYFKHSLHQSEDLTAERKRSSYYSRGSRSASDLIEKRKFQQAYQDNSQSSAFPETTTSNSDDQSDCLSNSEEFDQVSLVSVKEVKIDDEETTSPFIAYGSVYLSSEESSEDTTVIEDSLRIHTVNTTDNTSLLQISIENVYDSTEQLPIKHVTEIEIEEELYSEILKQEPSSKPKIVNAIEKKLTRFSDYATTAKRGGLENLTYVASSQAQHTNPVTATNSVENQYHSLPDINIGRSLKLSERIDAKLRSSYNISSTQSDEKRESTEIYESINRFGRAHKRARQRETGEIENLQVKSAEEISSDSCGEIENPKEAPSIEVEHFSKEINKEIESVPNQFRIIVTDAQDNVIEEDSIDNSLSSLNASSIIPPSQIIKDEVSIPKDQLVKPSSIKSRKPQVVSLSRKHSDTFKAKERRLSGGSIKKARKMSRPQIIHVVDSKRSPPTATAGPDVGNEFQKKVDSIRCFWSKLSNEGDKAPDTKEGDNVNEQPERKSVPNLGDKVKAEAPQDDSKNRLSVHQFSPAIEIVELDGQKQATLVKAMCNDADAEFDHVRYKVVKSNLFRSNIMTRNKKEAQFDGLIQYLQEYSFQELLTNNNVVIVEPVRTKIEKPYRNGVSVPPSTVNCKITGGSGNTEAKPASNGLIKRHFFYQPIRVNRELYEEELPSPDTVRNARRFFEEHVLPKSGEGVLGEQNQQKRNRTMRYLTIDTSYGNVTTTPSTNGGVKWDSASLSSGISSGDLSSPCECAEADNDHSAGRVNVRDYVRKHNGSEGYDQVDAISRRDDDAIGFRKYEPFAEDEMAHQGDNEHDEDDDEELDDNDELGESYYVSEDVLEKIRECGSSVTYYGGRMVSKSSMDSTTKSIIQKFNSQSSNNSAPSVDKSSEIRNKYLGLNFKLVKSNSCSSRLELLGTNKDAARTNTSSPDEVGVREMVHRLETGEIHKSSTPRIIESQCIEKPKRPVSLKDPRHISDKVSINNQMLSSQGVPMDSAQLADLIKHVTVNNHINFHHTSPAKAADASAATAEDKLNEKSRISRNRNVDLAFQMKAGRRDVESEHLYEIIETPTDTEMTARTIHVKANNKDDSTATPSPAAHDDSHAYVKHYVTNDRKLFERRKYDDIEFEEFEVYDPTKATDTSGESGAEPEPETETCYDSLDDKL